jgi:hypothetical protein
MAVTVSDIADYTDAEILKVLRSALVDAVIATQYSIGGRQLIRMGGTQIQALIDVYEERVNNAGLGDSGNGDVLVRFGEPR